MKTIRELDGAGIRYLWSKIKTLVSGSVSGKVDKVSSSTDNAIVRFDGTSGNIQNSGVTIDDSNNVSTSGNVSGKDIIVHGTYASDNYRRISSGAASNMYVQLDSSSNAYTTWNTTEFRRGANVTNYNLGSSTYPWNNAYAKKWITNGGTSSQFVKGDGSLDSNTYATESYVDDEIGTLTDGTAASESGNVIDIGAYDLMKINEVKGKSLVMNQRAKNPNPSTTNNTEWSAYNNSNVSIEYVDDGVKATILNEGYGFLRGIVVNCTGIANTHKYFAIITVKPSVTHDFNFETGNGQAVVSSCTANQWTKVAGIVTASKNDTQLIVKPATTNLSVNDTFTVRFASCIDLTQMFGAGNEPTTVEKVEAILGNDYYEYNTGEVVGNSVEKLDVTGFNIWDEEWEGGSINNSTGQNEAYSLPIRSKNYIPVLPNTTYYAHVGFVSWLNEFFYDANKNYISNYATKTTVSEGHYGLFTTPSNCAYLRIRTEGGKYYTYYNHDICINKSDTSKNGTYEPYKHSEFNLNLTELTGKVNGEGTSATIFPDGLHGVGTAYDSLIVDDDGYARRAIKRMGSVDLGSLTWLKYTQSEHNRFQATISPTPYASSRVPNIINGYGYYGSSAPYSNNDKDLALMYYGGSIYLRNDTYENSTAADFKTAMSGVMLYYELATPIEYLLDTPVQCVVPVSKNGTVKQVPVMPDSTPMVMDVTYLHDNGGMIGGLIGNYATKEYVDNSVEDKAPLSSPALTGTPTAPTAASGTNTTQIATTAFVQSAIPKDYQVDYSKQYLTTVARENGTISFNIWKTMGTDLITSISYSTDNGETWTTTANQDNKSENLVITVNVNAGDKVLWKGTAQQTGFFDEEDTGDYIGSFFSSDYEFDVQGNVMSLLFGDNFIGEDTLEYNGQFACLFFDYNGNVECSVVNAKDLSLPATTLADACYASMFYRCTSLVNAPSVLPATTLAQYCYQYMFYNCTSLTSAPQLPATTLASNCYYNMFYGCTSLVNAPSVLPATTLANWCYSSMFSGCTSLTSAPELPATTLASNCYYNMFGSCTSLTTAPELPATTLANGCYGNMFYGCTSLTSAPVLPATTLATQCYTYMFHDCTSLVTAPELPATILVNYCYNQMFRNCSNLNYIKAMFTTTPSGTYTISWVSGVAASGTFVKNDSATWTTTGANAVPTGWTTRTESEMEHVTKGELDDIVGDIETLLASI